MLKNFQNYLLILIVAFAPSLAQANEAGKQVFNERCMTCHQAKGSGSPGLAPPLVNPELWKGLGKHAQAYLFNVINAGMSGTIEVDGVGYYGLVMTTQPGLTVEQTADLADYIISNINGINIIPDLAAIKTAQENPLSHAELRRLRKDAL